MEKFSQIYGKVGFGHFSVMKYFRQKIEESAECDDISCDMKKKEKGKGVLFPFTFSQFKSFSILVKG